MTTQIFYDPATMQIMAVNRNCRSGGNEWRAQGFVEAEVADGVRVSRDHKVGVVADGRVVSVAPSINPVQLPPPPPPGRDPLAELDAMKARLDAVERR